MHGHITSSRDGVSAFGTSWKELHCACCVCAHMPQHCHWISPVHLKITRKRFQTTFAVREQP